MVGPERGAASRPLCACQPCCSDCTPFHVRLLFDVCLNTSHGHRKLSPRAEDRYGLPFRSCCNAFSSRRGMLLQEEECRHTYDLPWYYLRPNNRTRDRGATWCSHPVLGWVSIIYPDILTRGVYIHLRPNERALDNGGVWINDIVLG